jgi:site-specific recombinase XerC
MRTRQRRCSNCREILVPDCRNASNQRYCPKEECRRARNRESCRRWRQNNLQHHKCAHKARLSNDVTPHTFRRSCTTELLRGGANMYHVNELLGHESLETLKHYAKLTITDLKATHEKCHPREKDGRAL